VIDDDAFDHRFDLESELYTAMAEETDGLGTPELDMDKVHGAGRRRRAMLAGSAATVVLVGVTAAAGSTVSSHSDNPAPTTSGSVHISLVPDPSGHCDKMPTMIVPPPFASTSLRSVPSPPLAAVTSTSDCHYIVTLVPFTSATSSH